MKLFLIENRGLCFETVRGAFHAAADNMGWSRDMFRHINELAYPGGESVLYRKITSGVLDSSAGSVLFKHEQH
ncbi:MAG: hypothetical protein ACLFVE_11410, partial [Chitinispirillaceae bacterium]